ncbi:MAG: tetratricopeptide repeat protein [Bdellovibrionales bacterium]
MKKIFVLIVSATFLGCAGTPTKKSAKVDAEVAPKPTYTEKVGAVSAQDLHAPKSACPKEGAWNGQDWRKVVDQANACVKTGDWRKVETIAEYLSTRAHTTPWGAYFFSLAAEKRKDFPRALWMLDLAMKKAPSEGLFRYQLGRVLWESGEQAAALKEFKQASDGNSDLTDAHWIVGQIALQRGDLAEARAYLQKALSNDPHHGPAALAMAATYLQEQKWQEAEGHLAKAVRLRPKDAAAKQTLLKVREKLRAEEQAQVQAAKVNQNRKVSARDPAAKRKAAK